MSMEYSELFSRKFGLRPTPQGLIYDSIPETARIGLFHIIFESLGGIDDEPKYQSLYLAICKTIRIRLDWSISHEIIYAEAIEEIILKCEWDKFYEICQIAYQVVERLRKHLIKDFQEKLNALFKDEFLGFELQDSRIERLGNPITDAKIKEARILLKEPEFKGADELFEKAINAFNILPNPDSENCIKDAVAAIESVAKIVSNNEKASLDDIIKAAAKKQVIPQPLDQTITKLYAYRGNEPAVAHGGIEPSKVTVDEAELVLAMSAAMIIYLVKKRSLL